jgi:hypothetical protein
MPELRHGFLRRNNFDGFFQAQFCNGIGAEIGVWRAEFTRYLLRAWRGIVVAVDHWERIPGNQFFDNDRTIDKLAALGTLRRTGQLHRVKIMEMTSEKAASKMGDEALDWIYLDTSHDYESVKQDLELWWPKIRPGGTLAGHDILFPGKNTSWGPQVQRAVFEFAVTHNLPVYLVAETAGHPWSYYMRKPDDERREDVESDDTAESTPSGKTDEGSNPNLGDKSV